MHNKAQELQATDVSSFRNDVLIFSGGLFTVLFVFGYGLNQWGII